MSDQRLQGAANLAVRASNALSESPVMKIDLGALAARTLVERLQPCGLKPPGQSLELKFEIMKRSSA
jgi:hypothetical protein